MRRTRLLLAATAIVFLGLFGTSGIAHAEGEGTFANHAAEECAEKLEAGGVIEDCQKAPNPMIPEKNEILWGLVGFLVVFGMIAKFGLPAIKSGMEARTERIRTDLDTAEAERTSAQALKADLEAQLANARNEAAAIIEEARKSADDVKANLVAKAEADVAEQRAKAAADIEAAKAQALADLRGEVTNLAIGAAEQVVGQSLNDDSRRALVEAYIDQVGAGR